MAAILTLIAPFFLIIGCGFLAARLRLVGAEALKPINAYLLYFALPGMFISRLADLNLAGVFDIRLLWAFMGGNFAIWLISTLYCRFVLRQNLSEVAAINTAAGWGNSGYMGIPLSIALLGSAGLLHAFALLAADILVLSALAFLLHGLATNRGGVLTVLGEVGKSLVLNPFLLPFAVGAAISWYSLEPPQVFMTFATILGDSAFAVALFVIGAGMALRPLKLNAQSAAEVLPATALKLVVHPLLSGLIALWLGLGPVAIAGIVVLTATPTATNAYILAQRFDAKEAQVAAIIFLTTALSFVSLSAILFMNRGAFGL